MAGISTRIDLKRHVNDYLDEMIEGVHSGLFDELSLPQELYIRTARALKEEIYTSYATEETPGKLKAVKELTDSIYKGSAAKMFQLTSEMTDKLYNEDGTKRPFEDFKEDASAIFETYNEDYLATEQTTAYAIGESVKQWDKIQAQKELFPMLSYKTVDGGCPICAPLDEMTLPVDHPMWDAYSPPNHYNCYCTLDQVSELDSEPQTEAGELRMIHEDIGPKMQEVFIRNFGKEKKVFPPDHPYFDVPSDFDKFKEDNFGLKKAS